MTTLERIFHKARTRAVEIPSWLLIEPMPHGGKDAIIIALCEEIDELKQQIKDKP